MVRDMYEGLPSDREAVKVKRHLKLTPIAQSTLDMIKSAHRENKE
jgi:hypothetical protein